MKDPVFEFKLYEDQEPIRMPVNDSTTMIQFVTNDGRSLTFEREPGAKRWNLTEERDATEQEKADLLTNRRNAMRRNAGLN